MAFWNADLGAALGSGQLAPAGSLNDAALLSRIAGYKRAIAGRYRSISPLEIATLPVSPTLVSPKVDGQFWCLVQRDGDVVLVAPNGKVIAGDVPVLVEARKLLAGRAAGELILAGELFALRKNGRPRVSDVGNALGGGADAQVGRLGFFAFDLLEGGDQADADSGENAVPAEYPARLEILQRLLAGGQRLQAIKTELVHTPDEVRALFGEWVEGGKGEGLVVRPEDGRIYKLKPIFTLDAAVIGYTEKTEEPDHVRSLLLAVMRDNGQFQLIGSVGNLGTDTLRAELHGHLAPTLVDSKYRFASSTGALYRFVAPSLVVEVKVTDLQSEDTSGRAVRRMVLEFDASSGWTPVRLVSGVSLIHPIMSRVRDDKQVDATDIRATQVLDRVEIEEFDADVIKIQRPQSEVVRREVYAKVTKDKKAVRKLLVWQTHKHEADPSYPAFVVHWTDYSPGRKQPLQREVRLAPDRERAEAIAEEMIAAGVKRGWEKVA